MAEISAAADPEQPPQASNPEFEAKMQKAREFLSDAKVQGSPLSRRVNFLKGKGFTVNEIHQAFESVGQKKTLSEIEEAANKVTPAPAPVSAPAAATPLRPYQQPVTAYQPAQPAYMPPPQAQPPQKDWKDYFIGGTVAVGGLFALRAAASHFQAQDSRREKAPRPRSRRSKVDTDTDRDRELPPLPRDSAKVTELEGKVQTLINDAKDTSEALQEVRNSEEKLAGLVKASEQMLKRGTETASSITKLEGRVRMLDRLVERVGNLETEKDSMKVALEAATKKCTELAKQQTPVEPAQPAADGGEKPSDEKKEEAKSPDEAPKKEPSTNQ